jgi:hypothetical protein
MLKKSWELAKECLNNIFAYPNKDVIQIYPNEFKILV